MTPARAYGIYLCALVVAFIVTLAFCLVFNPGA